MELAWAGGCLEPDAPLPVKEAHLLVLTSCGAGERTEKGDGPCPRGGACWPEKPGWAEGGLDGLLIYTNLLERRRGGQLQGRSWSSGAAAAPRFVCSAPLGHIKLPVTNKKNNHQARRNCGLMWHDLSLPEGRQTLSHPRLGVGNSCPAAAPPSKVLHPPLGPRDWVPQGNVVELCLCFLGPCRAPRKGWPPLKKARLVGKM